MRLCITATGKEIDTNVETRFGRAPWFLIVDTDTGSIIEAVENHAATQGQGAGIAATKLLSDKNIDAILTGTVGPNAAQVFKSTNIDLFENLSPQDTVQDALAKFKQGSYAKGQSAPSADDPPDQSGQKGRGIAGGGRGMGGGGGRGMGGGSGQGRGVGGGGGRGR